MSKKEEVKEIKLFGKWSYNEVAVEDLGLQRYISLTHLEMPNSLGRHEHKRFRKARVSIVERLVNNIMRPGKNTGKKTIAFNMVKHAFEIINLQTEKNPLEVFVTAVENSAPAEDTTRLSYGGVAYLLSVDIAPQRRIDIALRNICDGARRASMHNSRSIDECLAEELILASKKDIKSHGFSKRNELERVAQASR